MTEEVDQDNLVGSEEGGPSLFGNDDSLALHIDIKNKVLSNETVEHVFTEFFDNVFRTGNGGNVLQKTTVQAVLIPELQGTYYVLLFVYRWVINLEYRHMLFIGYIYIKYFRNLFSLK